MRIQHNISALNASNRLKANDSAVSKNIAKLSSGYRINSAADDAAGLAVSEKMRSQINGLTQAEDNAQNGESLVQTAEGGLNETSSILQRMNTLAVEASNGTYQNDTDRANLQKEVSALTTEIDRISTSTNFNQINLLDGTVGGYTQSASGLADTGLSSVVLTGGNLTTSDTLSVTLSATGTITVSSTAVTGVTWSTVASSTKGGTYTLKATTDDTATVADANKYKGAEITVTVGTGTLTASSSDITITKANSALSLQVGADNTDDERATLAIGDMSSKGLGLASVSVATQDSAKAAIDTIKKAINTVDGTRADLGALQNELEHTSNNLSTMNENLTSAESNIRDVDMSDEYVQYSKNQILSQAANSMLAQANSQPQSVLTLLKG